MRAALVFALLLGLNYLVAVSLAQVFYDEEVPGNELKDDSSCPPCNCAPSPDEEDEPETT